MKKLVLIFFSSLILISCSVGQHPSLTITQKGVDKIRTGLGSVPLFDKVLASAKNEVDQEIALGVLVPIPKDMAGGYTHERHKRNWVVLQMAGNIYQITGEDKYANYVKESLLAYAEMYPTLGKHPTDRSYATGKIFWQCLNDANWLVYVSQAYDCIYEYLSKEEIDLLENDLFRPFADFLSLENPQFFNRIHNHSTWANAAVGMIGLAMKDKDLVDRALYGLPIKESDQLAKDNDGGFIYEKGILKAGFLAQLDYSFSPDGYFTEGPYYLRYAIFPFLVFSSALENNRPELDIMNYRDGILRKAVFSLINQTDDKGEFFPLNDAQKGMSWKARELVTAVDVMYNNNQDDSSLLSIVEKQQKVLLDESGFVTAQALSQNKQTPFNRPSALYGDGKDGDEGGIAVLRKDKTCLVMKYSAQGMGHGHFDKLSYSLYDDHEVLQDYGAARWVNIDQKGGGRYLKENKTFAKQTIAHNALVINETSHYEGSIEKGEAHHPDLYHADLSNNQLQFLSATDNNAYPGHNMNRSLVMLSDEEFSNPLIIDIIKVSSPEISQYDAPLWFMGHLLSTSFDFPKNKTSLSTLGTGHGYQHLWNEAQAQPEADTNVAQMCWFGNNKFYTVTKAIENGDEFILARGGANDPNSNLRPDPVLIHRRNSKGQNVFVSVIESHGTYNRISEIPLSPFSGIKAISVLSNTAEYTLVKITKHNEITFTLAISHSDDNPQTNHLVQLNNERYKWKGVFKLFKK